MPPTQGEGDKAEESSASQQEATASTYDFIQQLQDIFVDLYVKDTTEIQGLQDIQLKKDAADPTGDGNILLNLTLAAGLDIEVRLSNYATPEEIAKRIQEEV